MKLPYKELGIAAAVILILFGLWWGVSRHYIKVGQDEVQAKWDKDKAAQKKAEELAIADRNANNAREKEEQSKRSKANQEKHDAELNEMRNRLIAAKRVRVGTAICSQRPAAPAKTEGTQVGAPANPGTILVRDDIDRDLRALMIKVEEGFAAGRSCQRFLIEEGFAEE
jgi:hypothetical protein